MKNRCPNGPCAGCCRGCPQLRKKQAENAGFRAIAAFAPQDAAAEKIAVAPQEPPDSVGGTAEQPALAAFLEQHPRQGRLRVQTFLGQQAVPVSGAQVTVSRDFDARPYVFYQGETNTSGIADQIVLPTAESGASRQPDQPQPSATYRLTVTHPAFEALQTTVDIYENIETTQLVQMVFKREAPDGTADDS